MKKWYYETGDEKVGPVSTQELTQLATEGAIQFDTRIWKEGLDKSVPASRVKGLFPSSPGTKSQIAEDLVHNAKSHANKIYDGIREWDVKEEILPLDAANRTLIFADPVFWCVTLLGTTPLLIATLNSNELQLIAFALFYAGLWAVIFKYFILRPAADRWGLWIGSLFFTGIIGILVYSILYGLLPEFVGASPASGNIIIRLFGSILVTGLSEEICKSVPLLAYLMWKRSSAEPTTALMIAIFSGLGFAAFENVSYGNRAVLNSLGHTIDGGVSGLAFGVRSAMVNAMLRSISLVFCHGIWSGIVGHFASSAVVLKRNTLASYLVGIAIAATLHGTYNWLLSIQGTIACLVVGISFFLFYTYVAPWKNQDATSVRNERNSKS